jgi:hypothetical protein
LSVVVVVVVEPNDASSSMSDSRTSTMAVPCTGSSSFRILLSTGGGRSSFSGVTRDVAVDEEFAYFIWRQHNSLACIINHTILFIGISLQ